MIKLFSRAALMLALGLASTASVQAAAVSPQTMTPRRIVASLTILVALIGAVAGARTLADKQRGGMIAVVTGLIGVAGGGLVVALAKGGLGTGNGVGGGFVAMVLGLIGLSLGGLALIRSRQRAH